MRWDEAKLLVLSRNPVPVTCGVHCLTSGLSPLPPPLQGQNSVGLKLASATHMHGPQCTHQISLTHTTHQPGGCALSILFTCFIFILPPPVYPVRVSTIKHSALHTSPLYTSECYLLKSERKGNTSIWVCLSGPLIVSIGKSQGKKRSFLIFPENQLAGKYIFQSVDC